MESIRRGVAPEAGIQGRCDGAGSEVDGGRPSNRCWRALLLNGVYFGEVSERRPWIHKREAAGPFLPGFLTDRPPPSSVAPNVAPILPLGYRGPGAWLLPAPASS